LKQRLRDDRDATSTRAVYHGTREGQRCRSFCIRSGSGLYIYIYIYVIESRVQVCERVQPLRMREKVIQPLMRWSTRIAPHCTRCYHLGATIPYQCFFSPLLLFLLLPQRQQRLFIRGERQGWARNEKHVSISITSPGDGGRKSKRKKKKKRRKLQTTHWVRSPPPASCCFLLPPPLPKRILIRLGVRSLQLDNCQELHRFSL
jgi:hypothetical protein